MFAAVALVAGILFGFPASTLSSGLQLGQRAEEGYEAELSNVWQHALALSLGHESQIAVAEGVLHSELKE